MKCQNFLHPPPRHVRAPFPFFIKGARILLLLCFKLAKFLHPAFRDGTYLLANFLENLGVTSTRKSELSYCLTEKHLHYQVTHQWQFNSTRVLLYKPQSQLRIPYLIGFPKSLHSPLSGSYLKPPSTPYREIIAPTI